MRNRARKFNVAHTLTTHLGKCNFNTTLFTDHTAMLQALVLTTKTLVVLHRAKNLGAEQTIALRLERTIVDGLRLLNFAVRPRANHLW